MHAMKLSRPIWLYTFCSVASFGAHRHKITILFYQDGVGNVVWHKLVQEEEQCAHTITIFASFNSSEPFEGTVSHLHLTHTFFSEKLCPKTASALKSDTKPKLCLQCWQQPEPELSDAASFPSQKDDRACFCEGCCWFILCSTTI